MTAVQACAHYVNPITGEALTLASNENGLCECGCGQQTPLARQSNTQLGWVRGQPVRFIVGHNGRKSKLWAEEDRGYETPCWIWQLVINAGGYGMIWRKGIKTHSAHKFVYEERVGLIPEGLELDHLCRVRACVNPAHLEPVTAQENALRGFGACGINARKTHCKHGHEFTPENTFIRRDGGRECRTCIRARKNKP